MKSIKVLFSSFCLTCLFSLHAKAGVITFEEFNPSPFNVIDLGASFSSGGFTFSANPGSLYVSPIGQDNVPNSGSNTLLMQNVTISRTDGLNFNLGQFRIAEGRNTNSGFFVHSAKTVTITGLTDAGGTVNNYFNLDLIASENSLLDFQDVLLSGFTNLVSVSFTGLFWFSVKWSSVGSVLIANG